MRIAVVGCGPGGLASALLLQRAGHDIALFDQFDRPKPLGSGLLIQPSGQEVLGQLGLLEQLRQVSAPVTRLSGINVGSGKRALDMEYRHIHAGAHALGVHRASLFDTLFKAVSASGITILSGHKLVSAIERHGAVVPIFENKAEAGAFDFLLDASGSGSALASGVVRQLPFAALWATVDMPAGCALAQSALDQRYAGSSKMAGIMPVGINPESGKEGAALFWSLKPGDLGALKYNGLKNWQKAFLELWPDADAFVSQITSFDQLTLAIYRHRTGNPVSAGGGVFHIGDSWHSTSPQLGQGANMALLDAAAVAHALGATADPTEVSRLYRHARSDHVHLYQTLSYIFTPLYQSDSRILPWVRDTIIHYGARLPWVRTLIANVVSGNLGRFD